MCTYTVISPNDTINSLIPLILFFSILVVFFFCFVPFPIQFHSVNTHTVSFGFTVYIFCILIHASTRGIVNRAIIYVCPGLLSQIGKLVLRVRSFRAAAAAKAYITDYHKKISNDLYTIFLLSPLYSHFHSVFSFALSFFRSDYFFLM